MSKHTKLPQISFNLPSEVLEMITGLSQKLEKVEALLSQDKKVILTEAEAVKELKTSLTTFRLWRKTYNIPYFSEGKINKFDKDALIEWYKRQFGAETYYKRITKKA